MACRILLILLLSPVYALGQVLPAELTVKERRFGYAIYQGPIEVGNNRIQAMMRDCPEARLTFQRGRSMEAFGVLCIALGSVAGLATIGNAYFNPQSSVSLPILLPAAALVGIGIPLHLSGSRRVKWSTAMYNQQCLP